MIYYNMSQCITHYAKYLQLLAYEDFEHNCKYVINIMYKLSSIKELFFTFNTKT